MSWLTLTMAAAMAVSLQAAGPAGPGVSRPVDPTAGASSTDAAPPPAAPVQADDPGLTSQGQTVLKFLAAAEGGDIAAIRKLLAPDFTMPRHWRKCPIEEDDSACFVRQIGDTLLHVGGHIELQKLRVEWHIVRINIALSNQSVREEGLQRILLTDEFLVENGKIRSFIRTPRTEDVETRNYFQNRWEER